MSPRTRKATKTAPQKKAAKIQKPATKKATPQRAVKKAVKREDVNKEKEGGHKYWEAVGRRKTATARARLFKGQGKKVVVNDREVQRYFSLPQLSALAVSPLDKLGLFGQLEVSVKVKGGGVASQAEAVRHALARALVKVDEKHLPLLRQLGFLTRDSRMRERKKFGLKRARRAPQWSKR